MAFKPLKIIIHVLIIIAKHELEINYRIHFNL